MKISLCWFGSSNDYTGTGQVNLRWTLAFTVTCADIAHRSKAEKIKHLTEGATALVRKQMEGITFLDERTIKPKTAGRTMSEHGRKGKTSRWISDPGVIANRDCSLLSVEIVFEKRLLFNVYTSGEYTERIIISIFI